MKLISEKLKFVLVGGSIKCKIEVRTSVFFTTNKYISLTTSKISLQSWLDIFDKSRNLLF